MRKGSRYLSRTSVLPALAVLPILLLWHPEGKTAPPQPVTPIYDFQIVHVYPHDPDAFTQGLVFADGFLFESTGRNGKSSLRKIDLETGEVLKKCILPDEFFGEGLTQWEGNLIQLTWKSRIGFIYDRETFQKKGEFTYATEGWGITHDGVSLIMSDGSSLLRFLDPVTFQEIRRLEVSDHGIPVQNLNELEFVRGEILANVWRTDAIARISPRSGEVLGWIDLSSLRAALGPVRQLDVVNGIAYDSKNDRIFVTGKLWPRLFEVTFKLRKP